MIKRILTFICIVFTFLLFSGCGNDADTDNGQNNMADDTIIGKSLNNDAMEYQNIYMP